MDQAANLRRIVKDESCRIHELGAYAGRRPTSSRIPPRVMSVTSGKGGVGKTNIVGNLAIEWQRMGKRVLIFDADLGLANIDIIFGLNPRFSIENVIRGEKELFEIIVEGPEGVAVIPASSGIQELAHLSEGHKINLLNEFDTLNRMFDILLIDTGAGISSNVLYFNCAAQERIVVVTPEPTSITDAYALMKVMFNRYGTKNFYLLFNMVSDERQALSVFKHLSGVVARFMSGISTTYAGFIPWDKLIHQAVSKRNPVTCFCPNALSSHRFREVARFLLNHSTDASNDGNIKFFWRRLMAGSMG